MSRVEKSANQRWVRRIEVVLLVCGVTLVVVGTAPLPETPQQVGTLLIVRPRPVEPITAASAEQLPPELPSTASPLPLIGSLAIAASFGLKAIRKLAM